MEKSNLKYFVILILFLLFNSASGQSTTTESNIYNSWLLINSQNSGTPMVYQGFLYSVNDSSFTMRGKNISGTTTNDLFDNIKIENIQEVQFRKKGAIGRGTIYGSLGGLLLGGILSFTLIENGDDSNPLLSEKEANQATRIILTSSLTYVGCGIGILIGTKKTKIPINGSYSIYNNQRSNIEQYITK